MYLYCVFEEIFSLIKELGFKQVHALLLNETVVIGDFEVIPRRALDADVDSIFHIKAAGLNILNVVDSWIDDATLVQLADCARWDMVLWPFQTMREIEVLAPLRATAAMRVLPIEWVAQLRALNPRFVVPSSCQFRLESWSWYNKAFFPITYRQFQNELGSFLPKARVVRMNPSVSFILDKQELNTAPPLTWVIPLGEQNVDYEFDPTINPPSTAEISRNFAPLSVEKSERVFDYCKSGLLEKYRSIGGSPDIFFNKPRLWQLAVFDHEGEVKRFSYVLNGDEITAVSEGTMPMAWLTEVSVAKIYAALELGETLTSMYLRINDRVFAPEIEKEIGSVDVVEDPLIRCLFSGAIAAYQTAQLKIIKTGPLIKKPTY